MSCCNSQSQEQKCKSKQCSTSAVSLDGLISDYLNYHDLHKDWDRYRSIPEAVFGDTSFRPNPQPFPDKPTDEEWEGFMKEVKPNPHQYPIPYSKQQLRDIAEHLANHWNRNAFKDFEDLYDYVCSILVISPANPNGIVKNPHALILYDIALRLAHRFNVWPEKYVYLNGSGPYKGAEALGLNKHIKDFKILRNDIIKNYPELARLDAAQIEDFLCIYNNELNQ